LPGKQVVLGLWIAKVWITHPFFLGCIHMIGRVVPVFVDRGFDELMPLVCFYREKAHKQTDLLGGFPSRSGVLSSAYA
jgi:hypothetical protein